MNQLRATFGGIQARLLLAMTVAVVLAVLITGSGFVYRDRQERRNVALDNIAAATSGFSASTVPFTLSNNPEGGGRFEVASMPVRGGEPFVQGAIGSGAMRAADYRIILVDELGEVVQDPYGTLVGEQVVYPPAQSADQKRGYVTWEYNEGSNSGLTLLTQAEPIKVGHAGLRAVAAIDSRSLTDDWLAVVPQIGFSALIGMPPALLAAALVTRRITSPLRRLTTAVEAMSRGDFDQRVAVRGNDEVAKLASSFTVMAGRVKERDTQLRNLLANVSHDLRTPLTSIQGYAEAIVDGVAVRDADRAARIIRDEANHATGLLANLLGLSELDAGDVHVRHEAMAMADLVERCIVRLEQRAAAGGIEVRRRFEPDVVCIGDPDKIERVVLNLLDNALKFASTWIELRLATEDGAVVLSVANDGAPIPPAAASRIFERFYRAGGRGTGTGLGRAIAKELVGLNGGRLWLSSGQTPVEFRVSLPAAAT